LSVRTFGSLKPAFSGRFSCNEVLQFHVIDGHSPSHVSCSASLSSRQLALSGLLPDS